MNTLANEVVARLEEVGDHRQLRAHEECLLRKELKLKALGLAFLQRTIARQESRILWLREGGAPTKKFHSHANARRRRNFIHALEHNGRAAVSEQEKADAALDFFDEVLATPPVRGHPIKLDRLDLPQAALAGMTHRFSEEE
jgi:hypothetical protein